MVKSNLNTEKYEEVLQPNDMMWRLVNHLPDFNEDAQAIISVRDKLRKLQNHKVFGGFFRIFSKAVEYYNNHEMFPDINWLQTCFTTGSLQILQNIPFSKEILADIDKKLDESILKERLTEFLDNGSISATDWEKLSKEVSNYTDSRKENPVLTKEDIINLQDNFQSRMSEAGAVRTGMPELDDVIGTLGNNALSVFAGASGSGKTTWAVSVAYNVALSFGMCVDYVSYEVNKEDMWKNIISRHSKVVGTPIKSCVLKEGIATAEELQTYKDVAVDLFMKFNETGGRLDIIDQTMSNEGTFEGFKRMLEKHARARGRKADLIIIDNVDNLQIMKSEERDETTRVNNYIIQLDKYTKTYYDNKGTDILLLTQVNRTGIKKMTQASENEENIGGRSKLTLDVTCIQRFNALYEKAVVVLGLIASKAMRSSGICMVFPIKLRNRALPENPIELKADYAYSSIGDGTIVQPTLDNAKAELENIDNNFIDNEKVDEMFDDFDFETD